KSEISDSKFQNPNPQSSPGLWSELRFRLRRPLGILTGTIDKLLIRPADNGDGVDIEIIDFKTNRFPSSSKRRSSDVERTAIAAKSVPAVAVTSPAQGAQGFLDFEASAAASAVTAVNALDVLEEAGAPLQERIKTAADDYQLQMQAYALALRELLPANVTLRSLRATLHFIDPNVEVAVAGALLDHDTCVGAIDDAMNTIAALD